MSRRPWQLRLTGNCRACSRGCYFFGKMTSANYKLELYRCVRRNNIEGVRSLLNAGADLNTADEDGGTPLHVACTYGRVEIIHLLLERGADPEARNSLGYTPLILACLYQETDIIRLLLSHGADVNAVDDLGRGVLFRVIVMKEDDPAREKILDLFRELRPEAVMEAYCSPGTGISP